MVSFHFVLSSAEICSPKFLLRAACGFRVLSSLCLFDRFGALCGVRGGGAVSRCCGCMWWGSLEGLVVVGSCGGAEIDVCLWFSCVQFYFVPSTGLARCGGARRRRCVSCWFGCVW